MTGKPHILSNRTLAKAMKQIYPEGFSATDFTNWHEFLNNR